VRVTRSSVTDAAVGLSFAYGDVTVTDTTVTGCHVVAVGIGTLPDLVVEPPPPTVRMSRVTLSDNAEGIVVARATVTLDRVAIVDDPLVSETGQVGIRMNGGDVTMNRGRITGQQMHGVLVMTTTSQLPASLVLDGVVITRGQVGVEVNGWDEQTSFVMRRSTVRGQRAAVRLRGDRTRFDLGTPGSPGLNALSVGRGFALDDARPDPAPDPVPAAGTTLNGNSYAGQLIQGPVVIGTDLRIAGDGAVQF
jgi:hypothetical protein